MSEFPLPGPLDDFLDHPPSAPASHTLRDALLQRTAAMVRQRRRVRLLVGAGAVAAAAMLAVGIVWLRWPGEAKPLQEPPIAQKQPEAPTPPEPTASNAPPPVVLEWQAFDAPPEQKAALYRQAGDRYVKDTDDLAAAVRCYGHAVRTASAQELIVSENDNWLVRAIKLDEIERRKEQ
jgi:hypothetical protein